MARMSNRDRIARAAEEARLAEVEKRVKQTARAPAKRGAKPAAKDVRMKIVWVVFNATGKPIRVYAYPEKAAASIEAQRLSGSTGTPHGMREARVPME